MVEVESRRGTVRAPARVGDILPGHLFLPFHYGYWDEPGDGHRRAANELTLTAWDPVSKQPHFKYAAARASKVEPARHGGRRRRVGRRRGCRGAAEAGQARRSRPRPAAAIRKVPDYLALVLRARRRWPTPSTRSADRHETEPDMKPILPAPRLAGPRWHARGARAGPGPPHAAPTARAVAAGQGPLPRQADRRPRPAPRPARPLAAGQRSPTSPGRSSTRPPRPCETRS